MQTRPKNTKVWLAWLAGALPVACSLMAPNDDYFLRDAQRPRASAGTSVGGQGGEGGQLASAGGAGATERGEGGAGGEGGAARAGAGGETSSPCDGDSRDDGGACVSVSGCSDGTREGFLPIEEWPRIAGCTAKWPRASLRAAKTGARCGFETEACAVPADACGEGWHVCAQPPYGPAEISEQATAEQCAEQPGAYVAAVGDQFCEPCSDVGDGAACCGERCVQQNGSCIYPGQTAWFGVHEGYKNVCGAIESDLVQRGVLCCRD